MERSGLILMGLRGSGKTTLARLAGARLGVAWLDLDDLTPREAGCETVAQAWATLGEPGFRSAEVAALRKALQDPPGVLALGGGTPIAPGAADLLRAHRERAPARLVYLHAPPEELRARLRGADNAHRPALTPGASDPVAEVERVYAARDPVYRALADQVVETAGRTLESVVLDLVRLAGRG